jgi:hypothetical protein
MKLKCRTGGGLFILAFLILPGAITFGASPPLPSGFRIVPPGRKIANLSYSPAPPDNPLKGFLPYQNDPNRNNFPHSMSFMYFALRDLMTGPTNFAWTPIEAQIKAATNEGCHFVFRVYLDFPTLSTGIPQYLLDGGLTTYSYTNYGNKTSVSPNWEDPNLRAAMTNFIAALGKVYDGDPRIGAIPLGLLGFWGEWHDEGVPFASATVQSEVMDAFQATFGKTKLLLRLPTSENGGRPIGYHDDSFCMDTLSPYVNGFVLQMTNAGSAAMAKWQTQMIGGEVYPNLWYCLFNDSSCAPAGEDFNACVDATHASWLMNRGVFTSSLTNAPRDRALAAARRLGYEFHVISLSTWTNKTSLIAGVRIWNTGVAPFYQNWPIELAAVSSGQIVRKWSTPWVISNIMPHNAPMDLQMSLSNPPPGNFTLLMRVSNPLASGKPLRFANASQDATLPGWLTLGEVSGYSVACGPNRTAIPAGPSKAN